MKPLVDGFSTSGGGAEDCGTGGGVRGEVFAVLGRLGGSRRGTELFGQPLEFGRRGRRGVVESAVHGRRALQEAPEHGHKEPLRQSPQRGERARYRRRLHRGEVLPHEVEHVAYRVRGVGQRYRAARRVYRLTERDLERGDGAR
jgi:hypothetical protein